MKKNLWIIPALCCFGTFLAIAAIPSRKANLDYVRGATAIKVMHELNIPGLAFRIEAEPGGKSGVSLVSGRAVEIRRSEKEGFLTETNTTFTFNGQTKSYCMEIEPSCLDVYHGPFSESVAIRVPM